jgi:hypothetical protein
MAWVDPRTWFHHLLFGRIDVLLFHASEADDNVKVSCKVSLTGTEVPSGGPPGGR